MRLDFPLALWGLPLAGLPILLHLLSRRTARRILFSDLSLLRAIDAQARPKARLREFLLLAMRCLLLAALIFAASAPVLHGDTAAGGAGLDLILLLDASYSMRARDGVHARFEAAREAGRRLLRSLSPGARIAVGIYDEKLKAPLLWTDAHAADAALLAARPGWRGTNVAAALADAGAALARVPRGRRRAVVVLGDGAEHGLRAKADLQTLDGVSLLGLQFPALPNAWLVSALPTADSSARAPKVEIKIAASGAAVSTPLDLWVGEQRSGSTSATAPAGGEGRAALALPTAENTSSWAGRVTARVDALAVDDEAFYAIAHRASPRVLVLHSDPAFFRAGKAGWFLRELFGGGSQTLADRDADFLEAVRWNEANLSKYGTVLLADAARPPPGLSAALESFVMRGGGIWLMPGARATEADLSSYPWLPASFSSRSEAHEVKGFKVARAGFATVGWDELDLARVMLKQRFRLDPAAGSETWVAGALNEPLLVAGAIGRGRAVVWAAPIDAEWSNIGLKPIFIPWARACLALSIPEFPSDILRRVKIGEPLTRAWTYGEAAPDRVIVRSPDGQRRTLAVAGRRAVLPEALLPGLYAFEEATRETIYAVNLDSSRGESDLSPAVSPPWRPVDPAALETEFFEAVYGKNLSAWLLVLAAIALLAELFLSLPRTRAMTRLSAHAVVLIIFLAGPTAAQQGDRFIWTQLHLGENWDPYPDAPASVAAWLAKVTSMHVAPERRVIALNDPALFSSPFLYLSGASALPELRPEELRRLRQYILGGGFLWIEDFGGGPPGSFDRWVRRELLRILPDAVLGALPKEHVLLRTFFLLPGPAGRVSVHGVLEGVEWGSRVAVLYTRDDVLGAWAQDALGKPLRACVPGGQAQRELARRLTLNVVMYSLTGSYKSDAVHQSAILDKLKAATPARDLR